MVGLANKKIEYSSIEKGRLIGEGSFAKVYQAKLGDEEVAVKQFHKEAQDFSDFQREVWAMSGLYHANIVRLIGFCTSPLCIVSEFMPAGNLFTYTHYSGLPLEPRLYLHIAIDIAKALRFLHWKLSPPMIHNDLKTPNVLLASTNDTDDVVAKLTDFGLSSQTFHEKRLNQELGNPRWLAPEVLKGEEYSNKVDIYSFGVILYEMVTRTHYMDHKRYYYAISDAITSGERPELPEHCMPELRTLITKCWALDPNARPSINECYEVLAQAVAARYPDLVPVTTAERQVTKFSSEKEKKTTGSNTSSGSGSGSATENGTGGSGPQWNLDDTLETIPVAKTLDNECTGSINCMVHVPFLGQIWCGDGNGNINVYAEDGKFISVNKCHEKRISSMIVIKPYVWSCSFDNTVRVNSATLGLMKELKPMSASTLLKVDSNVWIGTFNMELIVVKKKVSYSLMLRDAFYVI